MISEMLEKSTEEYYRRSQGLLSPSFHTKKVLVVGTGGGSYLVEKLARMGPDQLVLVDYDTVDVANLTRTAFGVRDLGRPKAEALAERVRDANPFVDVHPMVADICKLGDQEVLSLVQSVDLVIAGTDHFPAQALLNRLSQKAGVPAVFIGIHEMALGGRIIWTLPGATPCYRCAAHERYRHFGATGDVATDLVGAHGLLVDVQCIDMVALKVAVALLERGEKLAMGRFFHKMGRRNEIIVRTSPEYAYGDLLWDAILGDLPTTPKPYAQELREQVLYAMDTVWLTTEYLPDCPDCRCVAPERAP